MDEADRAGGLRVREAATAADLGRALALRAQVFRGGGADADRHDPACRHFLIEDGAGGGLAACWRMRHFPAGAAVLDAYAAGFYDLSALAGAGIASVEMGRLAIAPGAPVAEVARLVLAAGTAVVTGCGAALVFGCVSVPGSDPAPLAGALRRHGAAPAAGRAWAPGAKARERLAIAAAPLPEGPGTAAGLPPLLRTYLALGARVGDHVVADRDLGTVHVFVGLEVGEVPAARARVLRALAAEALPLRGTAAGQVDGGPVPG